jgi:DNA repair exonuclease SbcCD nuclease subunit
VKVKILHIGDAHLGAPLGSFGEYARLRREEQEAAFRRAVELALKHRVHAVLISGDLFDSFKPDDDAVNLARGELARLQHAGIKTLAVPGTHDSLAWAECVYRTENLPFHHVFTEPVFGDPATLEIGGVSLHVYGIAYDRALSGRGWDSLRRRVEGGIHVALVHAACRIVPDWPIGPDDLPFDEDELAGFGMDYVALGHYHNLRVFRDGERALGAYPGSLEGRDWTETGPRHALLVEWNAPGPPARVTPLPVHTRTLEEIEIDLSGVEDHAGVADAIRAKCERGPLWSVTLLGEPEALVRPRDLEAELAPAYDYIRIKDATTVAHSSVILERVEEGTVRGEFFRRLAAAREAARTERERVVAERALKLGLRVFG